MSDMISRLWRQGKWRGARYGTGISGEEVVHWATLNAALDADEGLGHYVGTLLDIGDHKRSEVCLRAHGRTRHAPRR